MSLLNRVLDVFACSRILCARVLTCSRAWRALGACMFTFVRAYVLACSPTWRAYVFACLANYSLAIKK